MADIERMHRGWHVGAEHYELKSCHGYVDVTFQPTARWFGVANIYVEPQERGKGNGKALLTEALKLAHELNARYVHAGLLSREAIELFVSVLGSEAVRISRLGTHAPPDNPNHYDASAGVWYELPPPQEQPMQF